MTKIKVGHNPTANMLPMFYYLEKNDPQYELITDVPTGHNRLLAEGKIQMAPISAFAYGENWENYTILSDLSVSAKGQVQSIKLFSKYKIEELGEKRIALTNMSATSINLLKIILKEYYQVDAQFTVTEPNLEAMLADYDAALLIADDAILALSSKNYQFCYDLGEEWLKMTGLPMVFSFWTVRSDTIKERREEIERIHWLLISAKEKGLQYIDNIIQYCIQHIGRDKGFWQEYFSNLRYDTKSDLLEGINKYYSLAHKLGLLKSLPKINILKTSLLPQD